MSCSVAISSFLRHEVYILGVWFGNTHPTPISILWGLRLRRNPPPEAFVIGEYRAYRHGAMAAAHFLVRCPVSGVGSLNGSLLGRLRRDVALCDTASRAENEGTLSPIIVDRSFVLEDGEIPIPNDRSI